MTLTRRTFMAAGSAVLLMPGGAHAADVADDAGRALAAPAKVRRVFPAGPAAAILLYTLAPELLLGWPRANTRQACAYLLRDVCERPALADTADPVLATALHSDLILEVGTIDASDASRAERVQRQTGIPYALLDGRFLSLSTSYEKLGKLIGRALDGLDFADYCNMTLSVITNRIAFVPREHRPRVYYARGPRGLTTALGGASQMETIELLAVNVAGETQGGLADVPIERVQAWNPQVIVATDRDFAASVRGNAAWAGTDAVKNGRVHLSPRLPFGWVDSPPSANRLIGLWWLAKIFYPELFKEDMRELTRDFHAKFYHVTPSAEQLERVLAATD